MNRVLALCGGVGGAKLAFGLANVLPAGELTVAVNTGDDFIYLGLHISPDIDTVLYTLSGRADRKRGWGLADESWKFMDALAGFGGETWFSLGDKDLATHVERTHRLSNGDTLSTITAAFAKSMGIAQHIVPASDDPIRTIVESDCGSLSFQEYFVRMQCLPKAYNVRYEGADRARPVAQISEAFSDPHLSAVLICPSNPYLSIAPILAIPALRNALAELHVPRIAVSPLVAGKALKGPTDKLIRELGHLPGNAAIIDFYADLIDGLIIDRRDARAATCSERVGIAFYATDTVMHTDIDRLRLAKESLNFAIDLKRHSAIGERR